MTISDSSDCSYGQLIKTTQRILLCKLLLEENWESLLTKMGMIRRMEATTGILSLETHVFGQV